MKKSTNKGYILAETLIVTAIIAGVLIYLLIQLTNLSNGYEKTQNYNSVSNLYALRTIVDFIKDDTTGALQSQLSETHAVDLYDYLENAPYQSGSSANPHLCFAIVTGKGIELLYVVPNYFKDNNLSIVTEIHNLANDSELDKFIDTINPPGVENYRLIAKFSDGSFATIRFYI